MSLGECYINRTRFSEAEATNRDEATEEDVNGTYKPVEFMTDVSFGKVFNIITMRVIDDCYCRPYGTQRSNLRGMTTIQSALP